MSASVATARVERYGVIALIRRQSTWFTVTARANDQAVSWGVDTPLNKIIDIALSYGIESSELKRLRQRAREAMLATDLGRRDG